MNVKDETNNRNKPESAIAPALFPKESDCHVAVILLLYGIEI